MSAKAKDQHGTNTHDTGLAAQKKSEHLHLPNTRFFFFLFLSPTFASCITFHLPRASRSPLFADLNNKKDCGSVGGIGVRISPWRESKKKSWMRVPALCLLEQFVINGSSFLGKKLWEMPLCRIYVAVAGLWPLTTFGLFLMEPFFFFEDV